MLKGLLFGTGRFGDDRRALLAGEGLLLSAEGGKGTLTYRNYRGPDRYATWRREGLYVAFAITRRRVVADRRNGPFLDVPFDHPGVAGMTAGIDEGGRLVVAWDCGLLDERRSGIQELRLRTEDDARAVALLQERGLGPHGAG